MRQELIEATRLRGLISHEEAREIAERFIGFTNGGLGLPLPLDGKKLLRYIRAQEIAEVLRTNRV